MVSESSNHIHASEDLLRLDGGPAEEGDKTYTLSQIGRGGDGRAA